MAATEKVFAYPLVDVCKLTSLSPRIRELILNSLGLQDDAGRFVISISPLCGWLYFQDRHYKLASGVSGVSFSAKRAVTRFRSAFADALDLANRAGGEAIPNLLPDKMELTELFPTLTPAGEVTHKRALYRVELRGACRFGGGYLPVKDACLTFEVSPLGKIVGFYWQWRPIQSRLESTSLPFVADPDDDGDAGTPKKAFIMAGESTIQTHLAPYYIVATGHHADVHPASAHSLRIRIIKSVSDAEIGFTAVVEGGSGRFTYCWAKWCLWEDDSFQKLGAEPYCSVREIGAFNISLLVTDLSTDVKAQTQESIYFSGNPVKQLPMVA